MNRTPAEIPRRRFLGLAPLAMTACRTAETEYFGRTIPPSDQRLVFENADEPGTLDPPLSSGGPEAYIVLSLFEGLTTYHPLTLAPMAGLATHYELTRDGAQFTFYLREHPEPRGKKLSNTSTLRREYESGRLPQDFSRGRAAPPDQLPARWSDGSLVTAHDVVYSWRRAVDPKTGARKAFLMSPIRNADAIMNGTTGPEELGVQALDDFTLQVNLRARTPFFLQLTSHEVFCAVPRHAIHTARNRGAEAAWTDPKHIVTNGPFTLQEWRPYERIIVARNSYYYESDLVRLRQISFLPITDGTTSAKIYKFGEADTMPVLLPQLLPALQRRRDFHARPAFGVCYLVFNTRRPPFNNALVRNALNMAIDKGAIARCMGAGRAPASSLIPPVEGYSSPASVSVTASGRAYDVLSFDPERARQLLASAGFPNGVSAGGRRLRVNILSASGPDSPVIAEILQQQWRSMLGSDVTLESQEFRVWLRTLFDGSFDGLAIFWDWGCYADPMWFLGRFLSGADKMATNWTDPRFDAMVAEANGRSAADQRLHQLSECERRLLEGMPIVPLYRDVWCYLEKPYVRGLASNPIDARRFKYAWIDTNWRPS